jgi:hypothetical protein
MHPARDSDRPRDIWPPHDVKQVTGMFLDLADEALPGFVEGLYLHGSLGFGEWYSGRSDVDFVAVVASRPTPATVRGLRDVHARVGETFPQPPYDGFHVTWADLAAAPQDCPDVPCILGGQWRDEGRFDVNPVTWHELAWHGVHLRGPQLADVDVWTDTRALQQFSHANLAGYWAGELAELRRFPDEGARPDIAAWLVLGVPRLHHVLATGRLTSKDGAGRYAVEMFGERWRPVVTEALAYRAVGEPAGLYDGEPHGLATDVIEFTQLVLDDALAKDPTLWPR